MKKTNQLTARDLAAIQEYMKAHKYKLRLSILPNIAFRTEDGEPVEVNLRLIHHWKENGQNNAA